MSQNLYYPESRQFDVREEMDNLLFGSHENAPIGVPVIVRRIQDKVCACWDGQTGSPDPNCKYCEGEGFLWTEDLETAYIVRNFGSVQNPSAVISQENMVTQVGVTEVSRALAFMTYRAFPNWERYVKPEHPRYDSLYELKVDEDGNIQHPLIRAAKWQIRDVAPHRGDYGRVEYFECGLQKETK
jgi:hypothetical protein